jgi:uncharacterized protein (TIGR02421 family)
MSDPRITLDAYLGRLHGIARLLPALTVENAAAERKRLIRAVSRGTVAAPRFEARPRKVPAEAYRLLDGARELARQAPAGALYQARLDELELDLAMLEAIGNPKRVRPIAARRFGTGRSEVPLAKTTQPVADVARHILSETEGQPEVRVLPASALLGEPSLAELVRKVARHAGLDVEVRVEPRLSAGAATGERVVFVADRTFGAREALRLAVHEVLGHLVAAANGRAQPMRLFEHGTAGSFGDQEGVALYLEELAGVLDGYRLRILAARVWITDRMHAGAAFEDSVRALARDHGFAAEDAVAICERAYRGGGVARDAGYLRGYLRVRHAVTEGEATIDELRSGRVGLDDLPTLRTLRKEGLAREPLYCPSLAYSLGPTQGGTSLLTPPPSVAASLTRLELT